MSCSFISRAAPPAICRPGSCKINRDDYGDTRYCEREVTVVQQAHKRRDELVLPVIWQTFAGLLWFSCIFDVSS